MRARGAVAFISLRGLTLQRALTGVLWRRRTAQSISRLAFCNSQKGEFEMLKSTRYALGFAAMAAVFASTTSHAATTTQYPGIDCVQGGMLPAYQPLWYQSGHAESIGSPSMVLECPVPQSGGKIQAATVYGYDVHPSQSVTCYARAVDSWGSSGYWTSSLSSGAAFMGRFTMPLGSTSGFMSPGFKLLVCTLTSWAGSGSYVGSYAITED